MPKGYIGMRGASLVKVFNLLMLCEVIAYILSRQRLSAKTFVTGCVFYALQDRLSLWMLCDTSGVGKLSASPSHGFALRASPAVTHSASPAGDRGWKWVISSPTKKNKLFGGVCFLLVLSLFVALKNTIRASADAIRMWADSLIVFSNAIRIFVQGGIA